MIAGEKPARQQYRLTMAHDALSSGSRQGLRERKRNGRRISPKYQEANSNSDYSLFIFIFLVDI
jgi:hypothetical protein